jgi:hypothetical protein
MKLLKNPKRNKFPVITYQLHRQLQHKYISGHKNNTRIASSEELSDHQHNKNCRHISNKKKMSVGNVDCLLLTAIEYVTCSQRSYSV